ncbi:aldo/keto reductase [Kutzneria buriramensis]|uniref:aldo/keto reductase n=1 Tax=Kutzneria buriramensis TaxID=1045776 RepID=UPI0014775A0D|nr:aldo/keto reductase [Kutzneria buriramensis]
MDGEALPHIALGTRRMSGHFDGVVVRDRDAAAASRLMRAARLLGVDLFDTSPVHARGFAEADLGRAHGAAAARIWTKVGTDVGGVLPRPDYSIAGMLATLRNSCRRLRRPSVECVFVHHPPADVLASLDWLRLHELALLSELTSEVGVSIRADDEADLLLDLPTPMPVMVPAATLHRRPHLAASLSDAGHRLVVSELFAGGAALKGIPAERRIRLIRHVFGVTVSRHRPWAVVLSPRTPRQLDEYAGCVRQVNGKRAGLPVRTGSDLENRRVSSTLTATRRW